MQPFFGQVVITGRKRATSALLPRSPAGARPIAHSSQQPCPEGTRRPDACRPPLGRPRRRAGPVVSATCWTRPGRMAGAEGVPGRSPQIEPRPQNDPNSTRHGSPIHPNSRPQNNDCESTLEGPRVEPIFAPEGAAPSVDLAPTPAPLATRLASSPGRPRSLGPTPKRPRRSDHRSA